VSTSTADRMQLSPVPPAIAPDFTLTDQKGRQISLASLRGRAVVLTFMDPHCTDVCPIVSREFIDAHRDLGAAAAHVVFVAVNVNPFHHQISDVAAFSREQQLNTVPSWHFVTGSVQSLRRIWGAYQIAVDAPNPNADVLHTSLVYFIDPQGRERYVVAPMDDHTKKGVAFLPPNQLSDWAHGIALIARDVWSGTTSG
jgi:cytochrome oxidase Cu insertion factor (SCO1/SenC/PrrC family)